MTNREDVQDAEGIINHQVIRERMRQDSKWGPLPRGLSNGHWLAVLTEEVGEVAKEIVEKKEDGNLTTELIHVAAVAQAWAADLLLQFWENDEPIDGISPPLRG